MRILILSEKNYNRKSHVTFYNVGQISKLNYLLQIVTIVTRLCVILLFKAYEQIGMNEQKRLAFDSIDHKFDDAIPNEKSVNKDNFFNELAPVFELNAR